MNKIRLAAGLLLSILALSCHKDPATEGGNGGGRSDRFSVTVSLPQNAGKAAWTKSDRIRLYIQDGSLSAPSATLSSEGEGTSATFSASSVKNGTEYWLLYPQGATIIAGTMSAYAMIPGVQKAVAGGVDDDAFLMGGRTEKRSGGVPMEALCALVKFTLSGDGVSSVKKVTLSSDDYMAGDVSISGFGGLMATKSDPTRERAGQLKEVTLTGPFQSGSSYCFSVIPGAINLPVRLTFEDGQGRTQRVESLASFSAGNPMDLGNIEVKEFTEPSAFEALFTATKEGIKPYVIVLWPTGSPKPNGAHTSRRRKRPSTSCFPSSPSGSSRSISAHASAGKHPRNPVPDRLGVRLRPVAEWVPTDRPGDVGYDHPCGSPSA